MAMRQNSKGPQVICVSSGKGGVGKTSITVNVSVALARAGKRVLLVDGDLGLANVDIVLGLSVKHTVRETVEEGASLADILVQIEPGFFVLPASSGVPEMASGEARSAGEQSGESDSRTVRPVRDGDGA